VTTLERATGEPGPPVVEDRRGDTTTEPWGYVVFTDRFMSGWGRAPCRSLYALAVSEREAAAVLRYGAGRGDMARGRVLHGLARLLRTVRRGDHLAIEDRAAAERWYRDAD